MSKILLGLTGSISIYKAPSLIRRFRENGHTVKAVMTHAAMKLMGESVFSAVTGDDVFTDMFHAYKDFPIPHIDLAKWADLLLIAPASADFISKLARGSGDDLLSSLALAFTKKAAFAPAMNVNMWKNSFVQRNVISIRENGFYMISPVSGSLACNDTGTGRLADENILIEDCERILSEGILEGKKVLITAGAASENIDPVRVITNLSSGKTGIEIAKEAYRQRASRVDLICPPCVAASHGVNIHRAVTSDDFKREVTELLPECDIFIMSAAVSDYKPFEISDEKIKKTKEPISIKLRPTEDILACTAGLRKKIFSVGFALETSNLERNAAEKLKNKSLDLIVANAPSAIGSDSSSVLIMGKNEKIIAQLKDLPKKELSSVLIRIIADEISD
ncbi:bifunctional phosphopantothenoylcysteine decarboxylase/phosphopantothenate--cysteine ligase CoaBC [candidate division WOR-3 bacterium]|nr:bifunctional phosphopantothenoylcysteine decarboxylase/phosphopantothenate--cysteine ligase CoaBC [candidate division WOR-3 bacterium]